MSASLSTLFSTNRGWSKVKLKFEVDGAKLIGQMGISKEAAMKIQAKLQTAFSVELLLESFQHIYVSALLSTGISRDNQSWVELVFQVDGVLSTSKMEISTEVANRIVANLEVKNREFNLYTDES